MKLVFTSIFESDFAELVAYLHQQGGRNLSVRFGDQVCTLTELLSQHPELGRLRRDLKPEGIRSFGVPEFRNYLLFYQVRAHEVVFLRIRHGGMNLPMLLNS